MSVRPLLALPAALAVGAILSLAAQTATRSPGPEHLLIAQARVNGYLAEIRFDTAADQQIATVRRAEGGPVLWTHTGLRMNLGPSTPEVEKDGADPVPPGAVRDLTGDGVPELIFREWTGGAHCCFTLFVLSLGSEVQLLDSLPLGHSDEVEIADLDGDGRPEVRAMEWAFAYWNSSFMGSPAPDVLLSLGEEGYAVNAALQRRPAWSGAEMAAKVAAIRADWTTSRRFPPPALWDGMLELIYRGQAHQVPALLDCTWPGDALGRSVFLTYFNEKMYASDYYTQIDALNDGTLYDVFRAEPAACTLPGARAE